MGVTHTSVPSGPRLAAPVSDHPWRRANERSAAGPQDSVLVAIIARGDGDAFAELYHRHCDAVRRQLRHLLGNDALADELLQETFLQAWQQADRYEDRRASARAWLLVIARSRALDFLRSQQARVRRESSVAAGDSWLRSNPPVGLRDLEAAERRQRLLRALAELPMKQRQCVELAFLRGLSHSEMAERLREPLGTIKSRVLLGIRRLRQALASDASPAAGLSAARGR